jgi:hypothetical protein
MPEQTGDGPRRYFFEVQGDYASGGEDDEDAKAPRPRRKPSDIAAKEQ